MARTRNTRKATPRAVFLLADEKAEIARRQVADAVGPNGGVLLFVVAGGHYRVAGVQRRGGRAGQHETLFQERIQHGHQ